MIIVSTGYTSTIMDVVKEFGWDKMTLEELEPLLYALSMYVQMRKLT